MIRQPDVKCRIYECSVNLFAYVCEKTVVLSRLALAGAIFIGGPPDGGEPVDSWQRSCPSLDDIAS